MCVCVCRMSVCFRREVSHKYLQTNSVLQATPQISKVFTEAVGFFNPISSYLSLSLSFTLSLSLSLYPIHTIY